MQQKNDFEKLEEEDEFEEYSQEGSGQRSPTKNKVISFNHNIAWFYVAAVSDAIIWPTIDEQRQKFPANQHAVHYISL